MKCIITGIETQNKWNNYPVHTDAIHLAKEYREKHGGTLRDALIRLQKEYKQKMEQLKNEQNSVSEKVE